VTKRLLVSNDLLCGIGMLPFGSKASKSNVLLASEEYPFTLTGGLIFLLHVPRTEILKDHSLSRKLVEA